MLYKFCALKISKCHYTRFREDDTGTCSFYKVYDMLYERHRKRWIMENERE